MTNLVAVLAAQIGPGKTRRDTDLLLVVGFPVTVSRRTEELDQLRYAVSMARRAWLTSAQVIATRTANQLLKLVR